MSVTGSIPVDKLIEEIEKRNRLSIILPWLEKKTQERSTDRHIYNALGKIYVDSNNNSEKFLLENEVFCFNYSFMNL